MTFKIIHIFGIRRGGSGLAHLPWHSVASISLPLADATFSLSVLACENLEEEVPLTSPLTLTFNLTSQQLSLKSRLADYICSAG
jgi:hypothetical protein